MENLPGLNYALCVITCLGAIFTFASFVVKLKPRKVYEGDSSHKLVVLVCCEVFADAFYCCLAAAILVLITDVYINGDGVAGHATKPKQCLTGGFFTLFGIVECLFLLSERSLLLIYWLKSSSAEGSTYSSNGNASYNTTATESSCERSGTNVPIVGIVEHEKPEGGQLMKQPSNFHVKRTVIICCVFQVLQLLVWSVLCFIPLVSETLKESLSDAGLNMTQSFFGCVPLTLLSEVDTSLAAWQYSCFILVVLSWCPVIVTIVCSFVLSKTLFNKSSFDCKRAKSCAFSGSRRQLITIVQLVLEIVLWTVAVTVASVAFFGDGRLSTKVSTQWTLAYLISIAVLWHSVVEAIMLLFDWCTSSADFEKRHQLHSRHLCPQSINVISEVPAYNCTHQQCSGQHHYVVSWIDSHREIQKMGLLNVIPAGVGSRHLWLKEIEAARALEAGHPNIARHLWSSPTNVYSTSIANTLGDTSGRNSMLICSELFSIGSLDLFIESANIDYCMTTLRLILEQVSHGIDFIHSRHLVHNNLTSQCIYIADYSHQSHRVQAVIGKFEHSFKVTSSTTGTNLQPAVATLHATGAQLTAVDIQSFSLLVTELIVTASHRNKLGCFLPKLKAKSSDRLNSEATASDNVYNWLSSSGEALQRLLQLVMNMDNDQRAKPNGRQETLSRKRSYSSIGPSERSSTWSADSRSIDLSRPTTASTYDDCDSRGSSSCTCADRVTDIRARRRPHHHTPGHHRRSHCIDGSKDVCGSNGEGSPWQRAWFSDSESSAFREVNVPLRTNSSLGNLMGVNQRKHREHRFSGRQPSVVGTRLRHNILALQSENLMERDTTMSSDDVCTDCQRRDEVAGRRKSDGHTFDCISLTSGDSVSSMTSSSVASGCHPAQILARHQPMTTCRTKRRLAANGCTNRSSDGVSLVKSASYSGLKAISETGSVGRDATDTTSNASCSLCLRVDGILKTDVSHPALRGLYLSTIGVATTRTGSSAIDSDISSCSSSSSMSSDSRDIHSFSNESR